MSGKLIESQAWRILRRRKHCFILRGLFHDIATGFPSNPTVSILIVDSAAVSNKHLKVDISASELRTSRSTHLLDRFRSCCRYSNHARYNNITMFIQGYHNHKGITVGPVVSLKATYFTILLNYAIKEKLKLNN